MTLVLASIDNFGVKHSKAYFGFALRYFALEIGFETKQIDEWMLVRPVTTEALIQLCQPVVDGCDETVSVVETERHKYRLSCCDKYIGNGSTLRDVN